MSDTHSPDCPHADAERKAAAFLDILEYESDASPKLLESVRRVRAERAARLPKCDCAP